MCGASINVVTIALSLCLMASSFQLSRCTAAEGPAATKPAGGEATALFDGKTLKDWHPIGKGEWQVEEGAIVGRHEAKEKAFGHLVSDQSFGDFTIHLKFKSVKGNSGLYFRVTVDEKSFSGLSGFQAEIDPAKDVGGLYETNGRGWVVQPKPDQVKTWFKPGEWNDMTVSAHGGEITVKINGKVSAQLHDDKGKWREGPVALQLHGGQEGLVYFKDIEISK